MNKFNKGFAHFLLLVIVLTVFMVGGIWMWRNDKLDIAVDKPSHSAKNTLKSTVDDYDSWEEYFNKNTGIYFKYPPFYKPVEKLTHNRNNHESGQLLITNRVVYQDDLPVCEDSIESPDQNCILPGENFGREQNISQIKVNSLSAKQFYVHTTEGDVLKVTLFSNPKITYALSISGAGGEDVYDQILSTFEYIKLSDLNDIPPLYSGLEWQGPEEYSNIYLYIRSNDNSYKQNLDGKTWTATTTVINNEELKIVSEFIDHYINYLTENGWEENKSIDDVRLRAITADGPNGLHHGLLGYNGNQIRIVEWSHTTDFTVWDPPRTADCPCDIELSLYLSDIVEVNNVLEKVD